MTRVENILNLVKTLSSSEKDIVINQLLNKSFDFKSLKNIQIDNNGISCPHCKSIQINRHGKHKGVNRFYCKECTKTFTSFTGTSIHGIHKKNLWYKYIDLMLQGKSIRFCAEELNISTRTSFNWRHKILSAFSSKCEFKGILESDETYFYESQKGSRNMNRPARKRGLGDAQISRGISKDKVAVVVSADRNGSVDMVRSNLGRMSLKDLEYVFKGKVDNVDVFCTDSHRTYQSFASKLNIEHKTVNTSKKQYVNEKIYHVQHVNSIHSRLKNWLNFHFKGVSTKYIEGYLTWFMVSEKLKKTSNKTQAMFDEILFSNSSLKRYTEIENEYQIFMI